MEPIGPQREDVQEAGGVSRRDLRISECGFITVNLGAYVHVGYSYTVCVVHFAAAAAAAEALFGISMGDFVCIPFKSRLSHISNFFSFVF